MVRDYVDTDDNIGVHESIRTERSQERRVKSLTISPTQVMGGKEFVGTIEEKDGAVVSFQRIRHSYSCVCRRRADGEERTSAG
jgi:hypothetical protein